MADHVTFEAEFDRAIAIDDDSAAARLWAAGLPVHVARADTPAGHLVCIRPDGREELVRFDWDAAAEILGR